MDEKQLQLLFESFGKNQGFRDYNEYKSLLSDSGNRKMYFDQSNGEMGFKDYNEFESLVGFKKKEQSEKSVGTPEDSKASQSPSKFSLDFSAFIRKPQVGDNTLAPRPAQRAQLEEDVRTAPERKVKQQADLQTAIVSTTKKALQKKGINASENSPIFNEEKKKIEKAVEDGDAVFASPGGVPGLKRTVGWWESLTTGWNEASQASEEAFNFSNLMSINEKIDFVKKLEQAQKENSEYIGSRPSTLGYLGKFIGENGPFIGKAIAGSMAGAAAVAAAPETLGASLTALPTVGAFIFTTPDMAYQHAMSETVRRYQLIRKEKPEMPEEDAMKEAESGLPIGAAQGVVTNAFLMGTKLKIGKDAENAVVNAVKKNLESSTHMAAGATGSKVATDVVSAAQGYGNPNAIEEAVTTFKENMGVGILLNGLTQTASGVMNMPRNLRSAFKYGLKDVPTEQIKAELQANVTAGNIDAETANRVLNDIEGYKTALGKTVSGLSPESEASVTGLLQRKYQLETEAKTKDATAQEYYNQKIEALNGQIKKIIETNDPYSVEVDELTGETFSNKDQSKIEEIEKRRQEELLAVSAEMEGMTKEQQESTSGERIAKRVEINKKYDAEIASLEETTNQGVTGDLNRKQELEYSIKQLEENLQAKKQDLISKGASEQEAEKLAYQEFPKADREALEKMKAELASFEDTRPKTIEDAVNRLTPDQKKKYIDLVLEGKDAEADAMLDLAPEPPITVKKENVNTLDESQYQGTQAKVVSDVKKVVNAVSGFVGETTGNELSVNLHKNDKSFGEAVVNAGGSKQDASSKGFYLASDGSIHINMERATSETMLHEGFHPILDYVERTRPESINELYTQLESLKGSIEITEKAKRNYSGETTQKKEAITDFIANIADGTYKIDASNFEKIKNYFLEVFKKMGFDVEAQKIFDLKNAKELRDLATLVSERFQKGEEIKASEISKGKFYEIEQSDIQFAKNDDLKPTDVDYRIAEKIVREDKKDLKKFPEAIMPEVQREKDGKIKFEVKENKKGERVVKPLYSGISYELKNGASKYISKKEEVAVEKLSDKLAVDYEANKDRPEISAAIGWYGNMRNWFQKNFGANIELFGQLLAATSARTDVVENFKQSVEAMRLFSQGKYNELLKEYDQYVKDINNKSDEVLFQEWKERYPSKTKGAYDKEEYKTLLINAFPKVPLKGNGKKYNANSKKVLQALYGNWIEQTEGPKTKNFAGNLTGRSFDATIDVWAARYLRRIIYADKVKQWRIVPQSEGSVDYSILKSGEMTGDYPFAEKVMRRAAEKIGIKADDLQAFLWYLEKDVWDKNGWTNLTGKKKASFEEGASTLDTERYQAGVTTFKDEATFDAVKFEQEREQIQKEVGSIPGIIASRVTASDGEFYSKTGVYREPTFDVEFTVEKGADIENVINKISEIQEKYNQDAILISKFVDQNADNARPIIEIGLSKPIEKSEIVDDIKAMLAEMDVRGFTTAKDSRGRVLGIRSQFVPEFEDGATIDQGVKRFAEAFQAIKNKYGSNPEISYITTGAVDTKVKFKADGKEAKQNDGNSNAERGVQGELRGQESGEQSVGNRPQGEEGRGSESGGYREDGGVVPKSEDGSVEPQFSKQDRAAKIEELYRKKLLSEDEFNEAMAKLDKLYPNPTGVKNATVDEERIARGLEPLEKMMSESFGGWYQDAKNKVDLGYMDPKSLARDVTRKPRSITPEETAALTYGRMQLMNERTQTINNLEKAISSGDENTITELKFKLAEIEQDINFNDDAATLSGTMQGRALVARKMMLADDYSLTNVERRMKVANGGKPLPQEVIKKIQALDAELKQAQLKLQEYEKKSDKMQVSEVIAGLRAKQPKVSGKQDAQRASILARIREKMNEKNKPEFSRDERPNPLEEFLGEIGELTRSYVEEGVTDPIELVERVYADFAEVFPDLQVRDVQDAISGYGKRTFMSQEETAKQLREIKAQLRLFSALEDVEGGKLPEKSGLQRDQPSDEVRQLRQKLNEAIKESGLNEINADAETKYKTALDAAKKRLLNQIVDLENQIATGERKAPKQGIEYDQEAIELRNERDRLKGIIDEIDGKQGMTEEQKIRVATAAVERSIADLERRIADKDFSKIEDKPISTPELEVLRDQQKQLRKEYEALKEAEGVTQKEKLKRYKKGLEKRKAEYEERIAKGDFSKKETKPTILDEEAMKLKKEVEDIKFKFDKEKIKLEEQNKSKADKAIEKFLKIRREILLSSVVTLGKIATAGSYIIAAKPMESVAGSLLNKLPYVKDIAAKAPREGAGFTAKAEAKAITEILKKSTLEDIGRIMKGQKSTIETAYGKKVLSNEEHSFFGNLHALIKSVPKKGEIYRSIEYRLENARKNGEDITDPQVTSRIISEAIIDGNREIFMGDNKIVDGYRRFVNALEKGENLGTKIPKVVLDFLFPIIKVPTNYVKSTGEYLAGTATAVTKLASKGMKELTPQEADLVMRLMKKNLIGAGFFMLGYFNSKNVGGYYTGKREEDDLKAMDLNILGIEIPHWATHHPLIEVMQFGSTVRRLNDSQSKQGEDPSVVANTAKAGGKLIEEVPFMSTTGDVIGAIESDYKAVNFAGTLAGSLLVPPDVYRVAKAMDTKDDEVTKRRTTTVMEKVQERIPGLREKLPEDPAAKKAAAREKIREIVKEKDLNRLRSIRRDYKELYEAADIKDEVKFMQSVKMDKDLFRFSDMSSAKQIKRWSALSPEEKQKYKKFINSKQSLEDAVKAAPELIREARWKKAYEEMTKR